MKFKYKSLAIEAIRILKEVKKRLPEDHERTVSPHICDNISNIYSDWEFRMVKFALKNWINELLTSQFSLKTWVNVYVRGVDKWDGDTNFWKNKENQRKLQRTRQAWLDWMIQEIKKNNKIKS